MVMVMESSVKWGVVSKSRRAGDLSLWILWPQRTLRVGRLGWTV